jgi:hypothetical protein
MNIWQKSGLMLAGVALTAGALFAGVVYAQTASPTATPEEEQRQPPAEDGGGWFGGLFGRPDGGRDMGGRGMGGRGMGGRGMGGRFGGPGIEHRGPGAAFGPLGRLFGEDREAILAEALGLTSDELQAELDEGKTILAIAEAQGMDESELQTAIQAIVVERIDQAVTDGDLTESQAEQLKAQIEEGLPLGGIGFGMGGHGPGMGGGVLAEIIGEPSDLLAEATGMTPDELETAIQATLEKRVDAALEAGTISQSEADQILERLDEGLPFFGGMARPPKPDEQN